MELWITLLEDYKMAVEQSRTSVQGAKDLSQIIQIDQAKVDGHLEDPDLHAVASADNG